MWDLPRFVNGDDDEDRPRLERQAHIHIARVVLGGIAATPALAAPALALSGAGPDPNLVMIERHGAAYAAHIAADEGCPASPGACLFPQAVCQKTWEDTQFLFTLPWINWGRVCSVSQEVDPWEKAAECTCAMEAAGDPTRLKMLTRLRELWINLANEHQLLDASELTKQIAAIARIHAELLSPTVQ
jgi:hypothetical protein